MASRPLRFRLVVPALAAVWLSGGIANAADFVVTTTADALDAFPGDGLCHTLPGQCSLRAAIMEANALPGLDTIRFAIFPGPYVLTIPGAFEDLSASGDLDITDDLNIVFNLRFKGPQTPPIIDGNHLDRVFHVHSGAIVTIQGIVAQHGSVTNQPGGGIFNQGTLTLVNTTLAENSVAGEFLSVGGGISNAGTLTVLSSTVRNNSNDVVGGIANQGTLFVLNSTVNDNADGGILNTAPPEFPVVVHNSTVHGNIGDPFFPQQGVGITNFGTLVLLHSTVTDNLFGEPLKNEGRDAVTYVGHTILSTLNADPNDSDICLESNFAPDPIPLGHNLIVKPPPHLAMPWNCYDVQVGTDRFASDEVLGSLLNNGGPTLTRALLAGSPAAEGGDNAVCPPMDQRGSARPQGAACDIGAVEGTGPGSFLTDKTFETMMIKSTGERIRDCLRFGAGGSLVSDIFGAGVSFEGDLVGVSIPWFGGVQSGANSLIVFGLAQPLTGALTAFAQDAAGARYTATWQENPACRVR